MFECLAVAEFDHSRGWKPRRMWDREEGRLVRCCPESTGVRELCFQGKVVGGGELKRGCNPSNRQKLVKSQAGIIMWETGW